VSALFGGLLTKVGVYAIFRTFTLIFRYDSPFTFELILALSAFTMILGALGAISQMDMKRILSYHIISQIGYMIMGIGLHSPLALAGALFYIVHHVIVKSSLFLVAGAVREVSGTTHLKGVGGLASRYPLLAGLFLIPALSLAGMPPFSGFFSKLVIFEAGVAQGRYGYVAVGLVGSFLTLFSMMKIWNGVFWGEEQVEKPRQRRLAPLLPGVVLLVALTVLIGLFPAVVFRFTEAAGRNLFEPQAYIAAVLGAGAATGAHP
jgi:multicomponent Na+:H+ antiporter subunit D